MLFTSFGLLPSSWLLYSQCQLLHLPVFFSWSCWIYRLHLCKGVRPLPWISTKQSDCPIGWGCRIHWLLLCRGVRPPSRNECPAYDTKQSDGEVLVMLELWGMWSTPSLPPLPGPPWPGVVAPDKGSIYGLKRTKPWLEFTVFGI